MTQVPSLILAPGLTGTAERTQINSIVDALNSLQSGPTRPSTAEEGTMWLDTSGAPTGCILKIFDGNTTDISMGIINLTAGTFTPSGQLATFANGSQNKTGGFPIDSTLYGKLTTCDATSTPFTGTVADIGTLGISWYTIIKKTDSTSNIVTIAATTGQTINGFNSITLPVQGEGVILIKTGTTTLVSLDFGNNTVKQSASDTTPGYLNQKITPGNGIAISTVNSGGNEQLAITFNFDTNPGLEYNSGKVRVKVDGTTITRTASGLAVAVGTSATQIVQLDGSGKLPAVDGSNLLNTLPNPATSSTLGIVKPDNTSITISGGTLSVLAYLPTAGGIGSWILAHNATSAVAGTTASGATLSSPGGESGSWPGTWRASQASQSSGSIYGNWQRIA